MNSLSIDSFITKRDIILVEFNYFMAYKLDSEENKIDKGSPIKLQSTVISGANNTQ